MSREPDRTSKQSNKLSRSLDRLSMQIDMKSTHLYCLKTRINVQTANGLSKYITRDINIETGSLEVFKECQNTQIRQSIHLKILSRLPHNNLISRQNLYTTRNPSGLLGIQKARRTVYAGRQTVQTQASLIDRQPFSVAKQTI